MPRVRIRGQIYPIPIQGRFTIQHLEYRAEMSQRLRWEYSFDLPNPHVGIKVFKEPSLSWAGIGSEELLPPWAEDPIRNATVHIQELIVEEDLPIKKEVRGIAEHWVSRRPSYATKNPDGEVAISVEQRVGGLGCEAGRGEREKQEARKRDLLNKGESTMLLYTGTRVRLPAPPNSKGSSVYGTVIELEGGLPKGWTLLCMDSPNPAHQDHEEVCGMHRGFVARTAHLKLLGDNLGAYRGVPMDVGVVVPKAFKFQGVYFPKGAVGRVLGVPEGSSGSFLVSWGNVPDPEGLLWDGSDGQRSYPHCFRVPPASVCWGRFNAMTRKVQCIFFTSKASGSLLEEGSIVVYSSDKPLRIPGNRQTHVVTRGVLLKHSGWDSDKCCLIAQVVAGLDPECLGYKLKVRKQDVRPFEGNFLPVGTEVEVTAEVLFKKRSLGGRKGRVVLATDGEGDVGIEFPEDLGAGSLDGCGKEGRCLYLPAESVRKVSE